MLYSISPRPVNHFEKRITLIPLLASLLSCDSGMDAVLKFRKYKKIVVFSGSRETFNVRIGPKNELK
ncbi:MAG: hypothetical protein LAT67_02190 [Balneolales bacterium]|nr:hypothetical protein [Balneolales bacterium]